MTARTGPDCGQSDRVAEYAMRALPEVERSTFESHVRTCDACRRDLAAIRPVVDALVDWPTDVLRPPAPLWERLARRIATDSSGTSSDEPLPEARWTEEPPWREVGPGIFCKELAIDEASGLLSLLVRLAPGAAYPPHTHAGVEELHLLAGELWIEDRLLHPGDYNRAEPGTADRRVWSETGCTCVLMTSMRDVLR